MPSFKKKKKDKKKKKGSAQSSKSKYWGEDPEVRSNYEERSNATYVDVGPD